MRTTMTTQVDSEVCDIFFEVCHQQFQPADSVTIEFEMGDTNRDLSETARIVIATKAADGDHQEAKCELHIPAAAPRCCKHMWTFWDLGSCYTAG